jgi:gamma-glutamylcyclotransferase (GGCT)/AIG2-like uncharacterized protein YtfP
LISKKKKNEYFSVVGYGTFITRGHWEHKQNVEPCIVRNYTRIFPQNYWFPVVLPSNDSFWALKFDVIEQELNKLDNYEGINYDFFERVQVEVELKTGSHINAFLYIPTENLIKGQNLTIDLDKNDKWKEEIKKFPEIVEKFPELII